MTDPSTWLQQLFASAQPQPDTLYFDDDGRTPNARLPVLVYRAVNAPAGDAAGVFETLFDANDWPPQWRGGVFDYHHYHSRSHEALAVAAGQARLMLGGESGTALDIGAGDVLVLPAGTGHCRLRASADFELVGAYPPDQQQWDLCRPGETDIDAARERIKRLRVPDLDPVSGEPLAEQWSQRAGD